MAKVYGSQVQSARGMAAWGTALSTAQLAAITTAAVPTLTTAGVQGLTTTQISALNTTLAAVPLLVAAVKASGHTA